mgnify:FL=1
MPDSSLPTVPKENLEIFSYLYLIETALRELIIEIFTCIDGPKWYKKRLNKDALEKYQKGKEYEKKIKWTELIPHHQIYYIDFPDLKDIITRPDNWKVAFKEIFNREDIIKGTLTGLEPIRNKIAHNRKVTGSEVKIIESAYVKLSEAVGKEHFKELSERCTSATDIIEKLSNLKQEAGKTYQICKKIQLLEKLNIWESIRTEWWFDEDYLGVKLTNILLYFNIVTEYITSPRQRGTGHKIEAWLESKNFINIYREAENEFKIILNGG